MAKKALFVIDIQAEFLSIPNTAIPHARRIRDAGAAILDRARNSSASELTIVIVQHAESATDPEATLITGSRAWELVFPPHESPRNEMLVHKSTADTFESNQSLADDLKSQGISTIVVCGIQSDYCVRATCRGAVDAGFAVVLLQGAHSTYDNPEAGQSAADIEKEVEQYVQSLGVRTVPWQEYRF